MSTYKLNDIKMFCDIADNTAIIIDSQTGIYYGMNSLGTAVFENLQRGVSAEKILEKLKSMQGIPENLEDNFKQYMSSLTEKEIIIETAPTDELPILDENIAKQDSFFIDVREYNDAQELLLADPIHEVKEETGWQPDKNSLNPDKNDVERRENKME